MPAKTLRRPEADPVPDAALVEVAVTLERTMSWLRRAVRPAEWNAAALSTLDVLDRSGPLRITDLVGYERITQPGMTGLVARLAAAGLVDRCAHPSDGRATLVEITAAGRDYLRSLHERRAAALTEHLRNLPADEQQTLVSATAALGSLSARPIPSEGR